MNAKPFLDSNIIIYAFTTNDKRKYEAREIIVAGGVVSVQVLNEFINVARKKFRRDWSDIISFLDLVRSTLGAPVAITVETHEGALAVAQRYNLSIYDGLILAAARQAGCRTLYSEDMQHGQVVDGVTIVNPFIEAA